MFHYTIWALSAQTTLRTHLVVSPHPRQRDFTMTSCFLWKEDTPLYSGIPSASHKWTWNQRIPLKMKNHCTVRSWFTR